MRQRPIPRVREGRLDMIADGVISGKDDGLDGNGNPVKTPHRVTAQRIKDARKRLGLT